MKKKLVEFDYFMVNCVPSKGRIKKANKEYDQYFIIVEANKRVCEAKIKLETKNLLEFSSLYVVLCDVKYCFNCLNIS